MEKRHMRNSDLDEYRLVADAMRLVRQDDEATRIPFVVEASVLEMWDRRPKPDSHDHRRADVGRFWFLSAAAVMIAIAGLWFAIPPIPYEQPASSNDETSFTEVWIGTLATSDIVMDEDSESLQVVQLRIDPSVLTTFGFPVWNPADTRPMNVDVLIGIDGVPRVIRPATFLQE
jgi:hypothetical protein